MTLASRCFPKGKPAFCYCRTPPPVRGRISKDKGRDYTGGSTRATRLKRRPGTTESRNKGAEGHLSHRLHCPSRLFLVQGRPSSQNRTKKGRWAVLAERHRRIGRDRLLSPAVIERFRLRGLGAAYDRFCLQFNITCAKGSYNGQQRRLPPFFHRPANDGRGGRAFTFGGSIFFH